MTSSSITAASATMQNYFEEIEKKTLSAFAIASKARSQGWDPERKVDIPIAKNMAERVEGLISAVETRMVGSKMTTRIQELEKEYAPMDWRVGFRIAEEIAKQQFCSFATQKEAMEIGIRTGFAYLTGGIVSAPLEGFIELGIKKRRDGGQYLAIYYAGPIRGAGGTAAAASVILADYVRVKMGFSPYDPDESEVNRYVTEIYDYHERSVNLQYLPSIDEIKFMVRNLPLEIAGDPTEQIEVLNYKDLPRVETNFIRGGMCLVLAEGLSQKAPKLWKRLSAWGKEMGLSWGFLEEFLALQKSIKAKQKSPEQGTKKLSPNFTYITDLVAGRPVLTDPMKAGGFRLRYGRSRNSGFSAACVHPATMAVLDKYVAIGTQLKVERPGKAAAITTCDVIEPPLVLLKGGDVVWIHDHASKELLEQVEKILYLGDLLISYGDFSENGHILAPVGYCEEWWVQELAKHALAKGENAASFAKIENARLQLLTKEAFTQRPTIEEALALSSGLGVPLHPHYTFHWQQIGLEDLRFLLAWLTTMKKVEEDGRPQKLIIPTNPRAKELLEILGVCHKHASSEFIVIEYPYSNALLATLGLQGGPDLASQMERLSTLAASPITSILSALSGITIRDKSGTFIGARMGRPEKAKMRKLQGSPQVLFPVGEEGGRLRSFQSALTQGWIEADFPLFFCDQCKEQRIFWMCEKCHHPTIQQFFCKDCGKIIDKKLCPRHGEAKSFQRQKIDIRAQFDAAMKKFSMQIYPDLIKGVRGTSNKDHVAEHLVKGILRAKHEIFVNKDGTTRYDISELPLTHFRPFEIGTTVEQLITLGYTHDVKGISLTTSDQVLEIKPQDIVLPANHDTAEEPADKILLSVAAFIDELLVRLYGADPFYSLSGPKDLVGQLVVGLAPHISCGIVGRIIGFSKAQAFFAHPYFHAAMRRDADGDEACVMLLMDAFLNFSRQYLPDNRGGRTMDAPLVLTLRLLPSEVDDQAHGLDTAWFYPLGLYEAALAYKYPWEVKVEQIRDRLGTDAQYEGMGFTHPVSDINHGVTCSSYKTLPSMEEKLAGQMRLAEKIRAVDERHVASLVINKHFLKDIKGNLRKYSQQQFRCTNCNEKFRRPPLVGKCTKCNGKLIFTITQGSIVKYLEPSKSIARHYEVSAYLQQTLELLSRRIESEFGRDPEKQEGLGKWFG